MASQVMPEPAMSSDLSKLIERGFEVEFHSHAKAILTVDFPLALAELEEVLLGLTIPIEEIVGSGGGETKGTQRLRRGLAAKQWVKTKFEIQKSINGVKAKSISHEVDHVRSFIQEESPRPKMLALEIEWNNKDPFFDRDLENFKRLHAEGAISVGIVVTRGASLQQELRDLVRKWADQNNIDGYDALEALGVTPTRRQSQEVLKRTGRNATRSPSATPGRTILSATNSASRRPIEQARRPRSARRRQSLSLAADRAAVLDRHLRRRPENRRRAAGGGGGGVARGGNPAVGAREWSAGSGWMAR